jgi:hypothetical protein
VSPAVITATVTLVVAVGMLVYDFCRRPADADARCRQATAIAIAAAGGAAGSMTRALSIVAPLIGTDLAGAESATRWLAGVTTLGAFLCGIVILPLCQRPGRSITPEAESRGRGRLAGYSLVVTAALTGAVALVPDLPALHVLAFAAGLASVAGLLGPSFGGAVDQREHVRMLGIYVRWFLVAGLAGTTLTGAGGELLGWQRTVGALSTTALVLGIGVAWRQRRRGARRDPGVPRAWRERRRAASARVAGQLRLLGSPLHRVRCGMGVLDGTTAGVTGSVLPYLVTAHGFGSVTVGWFWLWALGTVVLSGAVSRLIRRGYRLTLLCGCATGASGVLLIVWADAALGDSRPWLLATLAAWGAVHLGPKIVWQALASVKAGGDAGVALFGCAGFAGLTVGSLAAPALYLKFGLGSACAVALVAAAANGVLIWRKSGALYGPLPTIALCVGRSRAERVEPSELIARLADQPSTATLRAWVQVVEQGRVRRWQLVLRYGIVVCWPSGGLHTGVPPEPSETPVDTFARAVGIACGSLCGDGDHRLAPAPAASRRLRRRPNPRAHRPRSS